MDKRLKRILLVVYVLALVAVGASATFAYFAIIEVSNVSPQVQTSTATTDWLIFNVGDPIYINANDRNFGEGMGDLSGSTFGSALLRVTNSDTVVSYRYNVVLNIANNDFEYTTSGNTAELLLTVKNPEGNEVTSIPGLKYVTVTNGDGEMISGFDITTGLGDYYIVQNQLISTNREVEQVWNVDVTFVNLASDQGANMGKTFNGTLRVEMAS